VESALDLRTTGPTTFTIAVAPGIDLYVLVDDAGMSAWLRWQDGAIEVPLGEA
jgi:hypothetical protein